MAIIDELLVGLGFEYDPKEMKQFKEDVGKTTGVIKGLARAAAVVGQPPPPALVDPVVVGNAELLEHRRRYR